MKFTLKEARPTFFFGVPRVWEKMAAAIKEKGAQNSGLKKTIGTWAKGVGLKHYRNAQIGYIRSKYYLYLFKSSL